VLVQIRSTHTDALNEVDKSQFGRK